MLSLSQTYCDIYFKTSEMLYTTCIFQQIDSRTSRWLVISLSLVFVWSGTKLNLTCLHIMEFREHILSYFCIMILCNTTLGIIFVCKQDLQRKKNTLHLLSIFPIITNKQERHRHSSGQSFNYAIFSTPDPLKNKFKHIKIKFNLQHSYISGIFSSQVQMTNPLLN